MKLQYNEPAILSDENIESFVETLHQFLVGEFVTVSDTEGYFFISKVAQHGDVILVDIDIDGDNQIRKISFGDTITKISNRILEIKTLEKTMVFSRLYANRYED
jgi:pyruvate-formate lyase-activating enzyme